MAEHSEKSAIEPLSQPLVVELAQASLQVLGEECIKHPIISLCILIPQVVLSVAEINTYLNGGEISSEQMYGNHAGAAFVGMSIGLIGEVALKTGIFSINFYSRWINGQIDGNSTIAEVFEYPTDAERINIKPE
jgi:hypothetical protein